MASFFCFNSNEWNEVNADDISMADEANNYYSLAVSEIDPKIFGIKTIGLEEYVSLKEKNILFSVLTPKELLPLKPNNIYTILLGDCRTKFAGLIFQENGGDSSSYEYMKFSKDGYIILIYLNDPDLLVVSE